MYNETITLVGLGTAVIDEFGEWNYPEIRKTVFAEVLSVGMKEFYQAHSAGFKPEIKFEIADYLDYSGESYIEYQGFGGKLERYRVVRTYRKGLALEIVCEKGID